jgi:hypothetical protein
MVFKCITLPVDSTEDQLPDDNREIVITKDTVSLLSMFVIYDLSNLSRVASYVYSLKFTYLPCFQNQPLNKYPIVSRP